MNKLMGLMVAIILLSLTFFSAAVAQRSMNWQGGGGWGAGTPYGRMYNPQTVETISGEVVSVDRITPMKGMGHGVHLTLKTNQETISVHLGPGWYIENQEVRIEPGDNIEVKGSKILFNDKVALIAAEIKKGGLVLVLRDPGGFPVWSGWRRR